MKVKKGYKNTFTVDVLGDNMVSLNERVTIYII